MVQEQQRWNHPLVDHRPNSVVCTNRSHRIYLGRLALANGLGYRPDPETEAAPEAQRERSLVTVAAALEQFTAQDFGTDRARWPVRRSSPVHAAPRFQ
jgi:hypothetical protein